MDPVRLARDELEYELNVRGHENLESVPVSEMRKTLSKALKSEKLGSLPALSTLDSRQELTTCTSKCEEIRTLADQIIGSNQTNEYKKFTTKLSHILGRLARLKASDADMGKATEPLREQLNDLEDAVTQTIDNVVTELPINRPTTSVANLTSEPFQTSPSTTPRPIPVSKWNISFSGDGSGLSINAFLERVNEFRISRRISPHELFESAIELLSGDALIWYRSVRSKAKSWSELENLMREEFEPAGYEFELWSEIRSRSQGPSERVGSYFARMINLFARLPHPPTEEDKLSVLRRNIAPYYIHHVGLSEVQTVEELLNICKKLENNRYLADNFKPPVLSRRNYLEPDLACPAHKTRVCATFSSKNSNSTCWNCQRPGHLFKQCQETRNKFCFTCGKPDFTRKNCPNCKSRSNK